MVILVISYTLHSPEAEGYMRQAQREVGPREKGPNPETSLEYIAISIRKSMPIKIKLWGTLLTQGLSRGFFLFLSPRFPRFVFFLLLRPVMPNSPDETITFFFIPFDLNMNSTLLSQVKTQQ